MKSLPVILLFLVSVIAVVAVLRARPAKVAVVPVPVDRLQARAALPGGRPSTTLRRVDLGQLERELHFRQRFRD